MGTTAYPGGVDDFATTSPTNLGDDDSKGRTHSERHDDMEAAMEAVQANAISKTLIDAKGDLIVGSAADTAARLALGANDLVLMAASGESTGLKWGAGAWTSYTPTLTGFTPGDGTATGKYVRIGRTIHFWAKFVFGSTSAAAADAPTLTLPSTGVAALLGAIDGKGVFSKSGGAAYPGHPWMASTTAVTLYRTGAEADQYGYANCSTTLPFTWAAGDSVYISGTYEEA